LVIRPAFVIELHDGGAKVRRGDPPGGLVAEFSQTAADVGVTTGRIYVIRGGYGLTLDFSTEIPDHAHQRFRNVLGMYRHRIKGA